VDLSELRYVADGLVVLRVCLSSRIMLLEVLIPINPFMIVLKTVLDFGEAAYMECQCKYAPYLLQLKNLAG